MKLHGKGKISFGQNIHNYLRISRNLEDEIFPKGVGVVTPSFYLDFSKGFFSWLEGSDLNFSSRELSLSYIFLYGKSFVWIHPRSSFGLGSSYFSFGLKTKCFSFGKITPENLFEFALWLLESPSPLSTFPSYHDICANPLPKSFPHLWIMFYT